MRLRVLAGLLAVLTAAACGSEVQDPTGGSGGATSAGGAGMAGGVGDGGAGGATGGAGNTGGAGGAGGTAGVVCATGDTTIPGVDVDAYCSGLINCYAPSQTCEECLFNHQAAHSAVAPACAVLLVELMNCAIPVQNQCAPGDEGDVSFVCNAELNAYNNCVG